MSEIYALLRNIGAFATILVVFNIGIDRVYKMMPASSTSSSSFFARMLHCCAAQSRVEDTSSSSASPPSSSAASRGSFAANAMKMAGAAGGLQLFYLTWGALQERVMTKTYDGEKFQASEFLVFSNRLAAFLVASMMIAFFDPSPTRSPFRLFSLPAFSNIISSWCQYSALKFVSFPVQVVFKSNKIIPVMIMGRLIASKSYVWWEYLTAAVISGGILVFMFAEKKQKPGHAASSSDDDGYSVAGMCLLLGYILFDSFTSQFQGKIFKTHKISPYRMMRGINFFSIIFTVSSALASGSLQASIDFGQAHPLFFLHVAGISTCGACGQLLIYYTIKTFGPLVFTIIMATRQLLSILLSCVVYGHSISSQGVLGMAIVFSTIAVRIYMSYRKSQTAKTAVEREPVSTRSLDDDSLELGDMQSSSDDE
jgi:adenosine 3'-phospho 5'-phosphosulfate transporter B2